MIKDREIVIDFLHLFILVDFAVAQPIYDLLGRYPEFFVAHRASSLVIIGIILILSIGIAFIFVLIEIIFRYLGNHVRRYVHWFFVFSLAMMTFLPIAPLLGGDIDLLIIALSLIFGLLFVLFYVRFKPIRMFMTLLFPVILVFPVWFLWSTPVGMLVLNDNTIAHADRERKKSTSNIEVKNPIPLVVVVFDEFSITPILDATGKIDRIRFPNFAALASESWWFPNAVGPTIDTAYAVPAIVTGKQPRIDKKYAPTVADYPNNLFSLLGLQYKLNVFESMTELCSSERCLKKTKISRLYRNAAIIADISIIYLHVIAPPNLRRQLPTLDAQWTGFGTKLIEALNPSFDQSKKHDHTALFLSRINKSTSPVLHFIHVALPHIPYWYLSTGHQYSNRWKLPDGIISDKEGWIGDDSLIISAYHQYLHQVGYVDRFLGDLLNKLRSVDLYNEALVIVTADHGVSFQSERSRRLPTDDTTNEIIKVPMFVKLPLQHEDYIDEYLVSGIDVLPTIVDIIGIKDVWEMDGLSMFSDERKKRKNIDIPWVGHLEPKDYNGFSRLEWQVKHFGMNTSLDNLIPKGQYPDLNKKDIIDVSINYTSSIQFISEDVDHFQNVNIKSGFIPAQFRGFITGTYKRNLPLAIALNGKIWANTNTSEWDGKHNYFKILIPPAAFKDGSNIVNLFLIEERDEGLLLSTIDDGRKNIILHHDPSGKLKIIFPNNKKIRVEGDSDSIRGSLDWVTVDDNKLYFEGWAANIKKKQNVKNILVFADARLVAQIEPNYVRKGVNELFELYPLTYSGFRGGFPLKVLTTFADSIKVIAIGQNDIAIELNLKEKHNTFIRSLVEKSISSQ